ncbi:MAG TPA: hypothetical protein PL009_02040 [Flavipsychrobacter sp.]|nr:hypothetical protein [Flavipsychrobacter sp.]
MNKLKITGIIALCVSTLFACKKSDDAPGTAATLTITQPVLNQTYDFGDTVHIHAMAAHVAPLHGSHVMILNNNNDTLFHAHDHSHAKEISIHDMWINNLTSSQGLRVIIACPIDHDGLEVKKEVIIKVLDAVQL